MSKARTLESTNLWAKSKHELKFQQSKSLDCHQTHLRKRRKSFYLKKFASMDEEASENVGYVK